MTEFCSLKLKMTTTDPIIWARSRLKLESKLENWMKTTKYHATSIYTGIYGRNSIGLKSADCRRHKCPQILFFRRQQSIPNLSSHLVIRCQKVSHRVSEINSSDSNLRGHLLFFSHEKFLN